MTMQNTGKDRKVVKQFAKREELGGDERFVGDARRKSDVTRERVGFRMKKKMMPF